MTRFCDEDNFTVRGNKQFRFGALMASQSHRYPSQDESSYYAVFSENPFRWMLAVSPSSIESSGVAAGPVESWWSND
ncbi:MAG: hypothetical protein ACON5D_05285 [Rubripirellula sp.]